MDVFAILIRWIHFVAATTLVGVFAFLIVIAWPAARAVGADAARMLAPLDRRLVTLGTWALAVTLGSGLFDLWRQLIVATGLGPRASLAAGALGPLLLGTQYGAVWLVRHGLLALAGGFLLLKESERDVRDWWALRLQALGLAAVSLALVGAGGHAASAERAPGLAVLVDALHLLAAGVWFGGLVPLALWLRSAATLPEPAGAALAAAAARRFSALGLGSVAVLTVSGLYNTWEQVGSIAALVGTPYGRWLSTKVALLLPLLGLAAVNRLVIKPRLLAAARTADPSAAARAARRLRRQVVAEAALGCAVVGVVAVLGLTTPARHAEPAWPFTFRLSWDATKSLPGVQTRVAIGSQVAVLGLVAALLAVLLGRRGWRWVTVGGLAAIGLGLGIALPPLSVDAYPTTYLRPTVPYTAISIARGLALYREHCAVCHGVAGFGDGPAAASLPRRPADLTARHTADHTVGDLYWWLSHGIPRSGMPGFADRLGEEDRWDLINFLRTLAAAEQARGLGPVAAPDAAIVAPDFEYGPGVSESRALKDYRGERLVVLVLWSHPDSLDRLTQLNAVYPQLRLLGAEVLAIPLQAHRNVYRTLGPRPLFLPIVVDGAPEAAATYSLFRRDFSEPGQAPDPPIPRHMELLIDRQGYVRARWTPDHGDRGWADPSRLVAEVERLATEAPRRPAPDDHVH